MGHDLVESLTPRSQLHSTKTALNYIFDPFSIRTDLASRPMFFVIQSSLQVDTLPNFYVIKYTKSNQRTKNMIQGNVLTRRNNMAVIN